MTNRKSSNYFSIIQNFDLCAHPGSVVFVRLCVLVCLFLSVSCFVVQTLFTVDLYNSELGSAHMDFMTPDAIVWYIFYLYIRICKTVVMCV